MGNDNEHRQAKDLLKVLAELRRHERGAEVARERLCELMVTNSVPHRGCSLYSCEAETAAPQPREKTQVFGR